MIHFTKRMLETAWYLAVILGFLTLVDHYAHAGDVVELDSVSVEYFNFMPGGSDPLINYNGLDNRTLDQGLNLHINTTVLRYLYWNSMVWSLTDKSTLPNGSSQFRTVGLEMKFGLRVSEWLDVGYYHFSKHVLDTPNQMGTFPVMDALEITIKIYDTHKRPDTLF